MPRIPLPLGLKLKIAVALTCLSEDIGYLCHYRRTSFAHPELRGILRDLHEKGYHVLRGYYGRTLCEDIREELDRIVATEPDRIEVDPQGSDHRIWGSERASDRIRAFHEDSTLLSFGAAYLKTEVRNITTLAGKVIATAENLGSGGGWHRDSMYEKQIKAIMYLSDVNADNGPFQYVVGSHGKGSVLRTLDLHDGPNLKRFRAEDLERWCEANHQRIHSIVGSAGDVILVDTRGLHRGMPILSGTRYALTNYYSAGHRFDEMAGQFLELVKF